MERIVLFELLNIKVLIIVIFSKIPFSKTLYRKATSQSIFYINQLFDFYMILVVSVSHFGINCNNYTGSLTFKSVFKSSIWKNNNKFCLIQVFYYFFFEGAFQAGLWLLSSHVASSLKLYNDV